jgi:hypothetical protein
MKLTRKQAAEKSGRTERWIKRKQEQGHLRTYVAPGSREVYVDGDELDALIRVREQAPGVHHGEGALDVARELGYAPAGGIRREA